MSRSHLVFALALALQGVAIAQPSQAASAPSTAGTGATPAKPDEEVLPVGTLVTLRVTEELTTANKALRPGQRFLMEVAEPVQLNGQLVIAAGTPAVGEVTSVRKKGMWGKSAAITARALFVQVNGRRIDLSGQIDETGATGTIAVLRAVILFPPAGFLTTGTSAVIPTKTLVKAFITEDVPIAMAKASSTESPSPAFKM